MPNAARLSRVQELVRETRVSEAMTRNAVTVTADVRMAELREILREKRISGTPVVEGSRVVGIVSIEDFIKWLADGAPDQSVTDRMTRTVTFASSDEPLLRAIRTLDDKGYGRLPVLENDELVGIITKGDAMNALFRKLELDYHIDEQRREPGEWLFADISADQSTLSLTYDIVGGDIKSAGNCSSRLRKTLNYLGMKPQIIRRIAIATFEAEMNAAIYADGGTIHTEIDSRNVEITVVDEGPGIPDVEQAMEAGYSTAPEWVRELGFGAGMGLTNIRNCVDSMELTSDVGSGTRLHTRIALDGVTA